MVLGAASARILLFLGKRLALTLAGFATGLALSAVSLRLMTTLLDDFRLTTCQLPPLYCSFCWAWQLWRVSSRRDARRALCSADRTLPHRPYVKPIGMMEMFPAYKGFAKVVAVASGRVRRDMRNCDDDW
jgi:hypothetical protein